MIERMELENFQRYESLAIEFAPVTVFVGPSDTGKSTLIRALQWVCFNDGLPVSLIRHGQNACEVRLLVDGRQLVRTRTKSENSYTLDSVQFAALGRGGVPDSVAALLNVTEANFQSQHDSPFWLASSAGEVSRQLNAIVDLGIIDTAIASSLSGVQAAKLELTTSEQRRERARIALDALEWVEAAASDWEAVAAAKRNVAMITVDVDALTEGIAEAQACESRRVQRKAASAALLGVAVAGRAANALFIRCDSLRSSIGVLRRLNTLRAPSQESIDELGKAGRLASRWEAQLLKLHKAIADLKRINGWIVETNKSLQYARDAVSRVSICPTCERPL